MKKLLKKYIAYIVLAVMIFTSFSLGCVAGNYMRKNREENQESEAVVSTIYRTYEYSVDDAIILSKLLWGEARGVESDTEKAAVLWCVLNRVDSDKYPNNIKDVVTQDSQFAGYNEDNPVDKELFELAKDVLNRWACEGFNDSDVYRVLPSDYLYFVGDGERNYFSKEYCDNLYWDWSLNTPYES